MENISRPSTEDQQFELPPGFRFHPTDEEVITQYLLKKVLDNCFCARTIGEVDFKSCEPWDLPLSARSGENGWYFFSLRDKKYLTGLRTNRATNTGYWKASGRHKEIYEEEELIGSKKSLVFYKGKTPNGEKTDWIMHEFKLEGKLSNYSTENEWVICKVFQKTYAEKKIRIPRVARFSSFVNESPPSLLPPLMNSSSYESNANSSAGELSYVTCFSGPNRWEYQNTQDDIVDKMETPIIASSYSSNPYDISPARWTTQIEDEIGNSQYPDYFLIEEESMWRMLAEYYGSSTHQNQAEVLQERDFDANISSVIYNNEMVHKSFETEDYSSASPELLDIGCLWNY